MGAYIKYIHSNLRVLATPQLLYILGCTILWPLNHRGVVSPQDILFITHFLTFGGIHKVYTLKFTCFGHPQPLYILGCTHLWPLNHRGVVCPQDIPFITHCLTFGSIHKVYTLKFTCFGYPSTPVHTRLYAFMVTESSWNGLSTRYSICYTFFNLWENT